MNRENSRGNESYERSMRSNRTKTIQFLMHVACSMHIPYTIYPNLYLSHHHNPIISVGLESNMFIERFVGIFRELLPCAHSLFGISPHQDCEDQHLFCFRSSRILIHREFRGIFHLGSWDIEFHGGPTVFTVRFMTHLIAGCKGTTRLKIRTKILSYMRNLKANVLIF